MNEIIDMAFIAAKVAAMKNEKAKMIVGGASLVYNVAQLNRFKAMIVELSQFCNCIVYKAQLKGGYTIEEYNLALECQRQIEDCYQQIAKHGAMTMIDGISLLIDGLNNLKKR